jgi:hypothetical protein
MELENMAKQTRQTKSKSAPGAKRRSSSTAKSRAASPARKSSPRTATARRSAARKPRESQTGTVTQTLNWLSESVSSPLVREAIAAALIAGAGAAAAVFAGRQVAASKGKSLTGMLSDAARDATESAADALSGAMGEEDRFDESEDRSFRQGVNT